jgi:arylsulfatase A-like enzyme
MLSMNRRKFLSTAGAAAAAFALGCRRASATPPNVVFVLTDDQRWDCMSLVGHPFLQTPNIDRLGREGALFRNAFVPTSICSPSRASFLSGVNGYTHGVMDNFTDYPHHIPSFHTVLARNGYHTAYIGKWHMGEDDDSHRPPFEYWVSHTGQGHYFDTEFHVSDTIDATNFNVNGRRQKVEGYYTHVVTDFAVDWIKQARRPFSIQLGHKAPHGKWFPEPRYQGIYDHVPIEKPRAEDVINEGTPEWVRRRIDTWHGMNGPLYEHYDWGEFIRSYHATIPSIDDSVGAIYETLRAMGELDNTIFIFAGDQGFLLGEHASIDKRTAWEESIRFPLVIRYPARIREGTTVDGMVLNMDVAPTILDWAGAPEVPPMQGRSVSPLLQGGTEGWRGSYLYSYNFETQFPYTPNVRAVRTDQWKYIRYPNGEGLPDTYTAELYYLPDDPREMNNLIASPEHQPKVAELEAEMQRLKQEWGAMPDPMPTNPQLRFEMPDARIR